MPSLFMVHLDLRLRIRLSYAKAPMQESIAPYQDRCRTRAPGFYSSGFDEVRLQADLGVEAFHIDLSTVLKKMESISDKEADGAINDIAAAIAESVLENRSGLRKSVKVYLALKDLVQENHLDALAIKCWPEFPQEQGFSVCLSISLLNNAGIVAACEGDVQGCVNAHPKLAG